MRCQVRLPDLKGNSGIQIRSEYVDQSKFILRGPQVDAGVGYWGGLHGELTTGVMKAAPAEVVNRVVKPDDFNDLFVRCVGKRVTIMLNGETTVDEDFPAMADEGVIGLQLHAGKTDVIFRNIELKELDNSTVDLFNGRDLAGWTGDAGQMNGENGVLINEGKKGVPVAPGDYQNVEIEVQFRLENGGNSGLGICYSGDGDPAMNGLEIQMIDDVEYPNDKDTQKCGIHLGASRCQARAF